MLDSETLTVSLRDSEGKSLDQRLHSETLKARVSTKRLLRLYLETLKARGVTKILLRSNSEKLRARVLSKGILRLHSEFSP